MYGIFQPIKNMKMIMFSQNVILNKYTTKRKELDIICGIVIQSYTSGPIYLYSFHKLTYAILS